MKVIEATFNKEQGLVSNLSKYHLFITVSISKLRNLSARRHVTFDTKQQEQEQGEDRGTWEGWDNPFHVQGELSQEAETILALWRRGCLDTYRDGRCQLAV